MKEKKIIYFTKKSEEKIFISLDFTAMWNIDEKRQLLGDNPLETGNQHVRDTTKPITCLYTMRVWVFENNKRVLMPESYLNKRKHSREILRGFEECKIWRHSANALTIMVHGWWSPRGRMDDVLPYIHVRLPVSGGLCLKICLNPSIFHIAVKPK